MQAIIDEPLICYHICSYLKPWDLDQLRRTNSTFLEATTLLLGDIKVIGTCGIYTIGSSDMIHVPYMDKAIERKKMFGETESNYVWMFNGLFCRFMKNGVDYILLGDNIGIIKNDCIVIYYSYFSNETLIGKRVHASDSITYMNNITKRCAVNNGGSLVSSLFEEAIIMGKTNSYTDARFSHEDYVFTEVDDGISMRPKSGLATIEEFVDVAGDIINVMKIMFDGRLLLY